MIISKQPSEQFANYTITDEQRKKLMTSAAMINDKSSDGTYWMWESVSNRMGLTPRHVSENFVNIRIKVGMPND